MLKLLLGSWTGDTMMRPIRSVCNQLASLSVDRVSTDSTWKLPDGNSSDSIYQSMLKFSNINTNVPLELSSNNCHLPKARVGETQKQTKLPCNPSSLSVKFAFQWLNWIWTFSNLIFPSLTFVSILSCSQRFLLGISAFTNKSLNFCFSYISSLYKHAVIGLIAEANKSVPWPFYLPIFRARAKIQSRANSLKKLSSSLFPIHPALYNVMKWSHFQTPK